ncbi:MAG: amidohydrolase family protein [Hyphomicrobiaceae bacterium]
MRIMLTKEPGRNSDPNHPGLDRILKAAVKYDFPVNMLCWGNVDAGMGLVDRHPDTRFIIDHLAVMQPRARAAGWASWADLPESFRSWPSARTRSSRSAGLALSRRSLSVQRIWDPLARVFDAWGLDRCLWGTDWTRAHAVVNYRQAGEDRSS